MKVLKDNTIVGETKFGEVLGELEANNVSRDNHSQNIWDKLWFSFETAHYLKSLIFVFQEFFACIDKIFILIGRLGNRLSFNEV